MKCCFDQYNTDIDEINIDTKMLYLVYLHSFLPECDVRGFPNRWDPARLLRMCLHKLVETLSDRLIRRCVFDKIFSRYEESLDQRSVYNYCRRVKFDGAILKITLGIHEKSKTTTCVIATLWWNIFGCVAAGAAAAQKKKPYVFGKVIASRIAVQLESS